MPTLVKEQKCETCTFCRDHQCRANPPVIVPIPEQASSDRVFVTTWPEVCDEDWCGSYESVSPPDKGLPVISKCEFCDYTDGFAVDLKGLVTCQKCFKQWEVV